MRCFMLMCNRQVENLEETFDAIANGTHVAEMATINVAHFPTSNTMALHDMPSSYWSPK